MQNLNQNRTNVTTNLKDFLNKRDVSAKHYATLVGKNLGNNTLNLVIQLQALMDVSEVANEKNISESFDLEGQATAQRRFDPAHAARLGTFMLRAGAAEACRKRIAQGLSIQPELEEIR